MDHCLHDFLSPRRALTIHSAPFRPGRGLGCSAFKEYSHRPIVEAISRFQGAHGYEYRLEAT